MPVVYSDGQKAFTRLQEENLEDIWRSEYFWWEFHESRVCMFHRQNRLTLCNVITHKYYIGLVYASHYTTCYWPKSFFDTVNVGPSEQEFMVVIRTRGVPRNAYARIYSVSTKTVPGTPRNSSDDLHAPDAHNAATSRIYDACRNLPSIERALFTGTDRGGLSASATTSTGQKLCSGTCVAPTDRIVVGYDLWRPNAIVQCPTCK